MEDKKQKHNEEEERKKLQKELNEYIPVKRDVFAKLKSYNKDSGLKVAGESKNSTSKKSTKENEENMILKERANRYSYGGKIINFSFLKGVDRKLVDERYGMTFAEFKRRELNL